VTDSKCPIVVRGLHKAYGARTVLQGIDLTVERGEVLALLGPNGAGKTTTVEILEGYRDADAGDVEVLGHVPSTHPAELRERTGIVLQECGFPHHLRLDELVDAWRSYYRRPRPTDELLALVELTDHRRQLVRRLSGGQRRRLDFALALAGDPEVVFLDEPTTGFDPESRRRCWDAISNLAALGKTILLTTHYLDEAERLADRVAILAGGRIRAVGTSRELAAIAGTPTSISYRPPDGDRVTVLTEEPSAALQSLIGEVGELPDLTVEPPTLEASYLRLVAS
jgi:ABC-2 type transport system ATP-binding protein